MADSIFQPMRFTIDLDSALVTQTGCGQLIYGDKSANVIEVKVHRGGKTIDLTGMTATGAFYRPVDGAEVPLPGAISANVASVQLIDECYETEGHYEAEVKLSQGEVRRTILSIVGYVHRAGSGAVVNVTGVVPSIPELLAQISAMEAAAERANTAAARAEALAIDANGYAQNTKQLNGKSADEYALKTYVNNLVGAKTSFITVGDTGCDFETVVDAVTYAKTVASASNRVCIVINNGTYVGSINLLGNCGIDLVAPAGAQIIGDTAYPEAALFVGGDATFVNIDFESTVSGTYACHIESLSDASGGKQRFINCTFRGDAAGIGVGSGDNYSQRFENCEFAAISSTNAAYLHNNPILEGDGEIYFSNCVFRGAVFATEYEGNSSKILCTFIGCGAENVVYGRGTTEELAFESHFDNASKLTLSDMCSGNTAPALNYGGGVKNVALTAYTLLNGLASAYIPGLSKYNFNIVRALQEDVATRLNASYAANGDCLTIVAEEYTGTIYLEISMIPK